MAAIAVRRPSTLQEWLYRNRDRALAVVAFVSVFIIIMPALWLILTSFKANENIFVFPPQVIPNPFTFQNYIDVIQQGNFPRYLFNSVVVTSISTLICMVFSALAAYALTFFRFVGRRVVLTLVVGTQFFPSAILLLPLFRMWADMGMFNTYFSLIATYTASSLSLCTWLLVGFYRAIPEEVIDAATIDGCGRLGLLWRIVLPLAIPGIMAGGAFVFIGVWQEFLLAVTLISDPNMLTVMVGLFKFIGEHHIAWNLLIAASVVVSIPTIIIFGLVQRYIVDGVMSGALK
ncbi:MAG: carbohydrate ABC transporter permease [Anaerolineae bacterium]|nr:carbohydrate ABC transporter permease [Anaerolineae bacterium]